MASRCSLYPYGSTSFKLRLFIFSLNPAAAKHISRWRASVKPSLCLSIKDHRHAYWLDLAEVEDNLAPILLGELLQDDFQLLGHTEAQTAEPELLNDLQLEELSQVPFIGLGTKYIFEKPHPIDLPSCLREGVPN